VIVDRYGYHAVLQTLTLAMDLRKALIVEALKNSITLHSIIERNDAVVRRAEGMEPRVGILLGEAPAETGIEVAGLRLTVDLRHAQKTGFYLDQVGHYETVAQHAKGRRVLDCFASQGAFALSCAKAEAAHVTAVEGSSESVAQARQNAERNSLPVEWVEQDVFQFLRSAEKSSAEYDLIILDPPSFTKTKGGLRDALRGYRELHVRAFKLLSRDGLLATFSCSHHVSESIFNQTISDALVDARRSARRLHRFEQALDHPVLSTLPETEYFKGVLLEMMPGR
jgi:23S rRNA (cytosine1962-C5)-methyltransferase